MTDVIYDYRERVAQIEKYLNFLLVIDSLSDLGDLSSIKSKKILIREDKEISVGSVLSSTGTFKIEGELNKVLKSNTILLLYNLIEGTINAVLNEYFGSINKEGLKYSRYRTEVKNIWIKYKHRSFSVKEKSEATYIANTIECILEEIVSISPKSIKDAEHGTRNLHNYEAYVAETQANDISGNLDARKIREIFAQYGLPELTLKCDSMLSIKSKRNSLAHGNETFAQVGGKFTIQELFRIKEEVKTFLDFVLEQTEDHINKKKYLVPSIPWWKKVLRVLS